MDVVGLIMAYEQGDLDYDSTIALFQELVNSGLAWQLQGSYGRAAMDMIRAGVISSPVRRTPSGRQIRIVDREVDV